jgi:hypothetical protein
VHLSQSGSHVYKGWAASRQMQAILLKFGFVKADVALEWQEINEFLSAQPISEEKPMSTSPVSTSSLNQQIHEYFQTRNSDLKQLGQDLEAGNTSAAQSDFNNIVTLGQNGPLPNGEDFLVPERQQDFNNIGQALQNGNLSGAQQAFTQLAETFQNSQQATPPIQASSGSGSSTGTGPEIVLNVGGGNTSTPEQVTINISNAANGGGEQVSVSVGSQGSNAQQVAFNLGANTNEQIVLNLLGAGAASTGSSSSGSNLSVSA